MNSTATLRKKRITTILAIVFDIVMITSFFSIIGVYYYSDQKSRSFWKFGLTCNFIVLLFEFRMRVLKCCGYPLNEMLEVGFCCVFTRIRMKLADIVCFFYVFFAEMINATILITSQYKSDKEKVMFTLIVVLDAIYLLLWIIFTNSKSYKRFPKEKRRLQPPLQQQEILPQVDQLQIQHNIQQRRHMVQQNEERKKLNKREAKTLVKSMTLVQPIVNSKKKFLSDTRICEDDQNKEIDHQICCICLEQLKVFNEDRIPSYHSNINNDINQELVHKQTKRSGFFTKLLKRSKSEVSHIRAFPECQHLFHEQCLVQWIEENDTCPMCRRKSSSTSIDSVDEGDHSDDNQSSDDDIENLLFAENGNPNINDQTDITQANFNIQ